MMKFDMSYDYDNFNLWSSIRKLIIKKKVKYFIIYKYYNFKENQKEIDNSLYFLNFLVMLHHSWINQIFIL